MAKKTKTLEEHLKFLGENIRKTRLEKKMTQAELAIKSDLDKQSIFRIEKGQLNITVHTLFNIADALEVTTGKLMYGKWIFGFKVQKIIIRADN